MATLSEKFVALIEKHKEAGTGEKKGILAAMTTQLQKIANSEPRDFDVEELEERLMIINFVKGMADQFNPALMEQLEEFEKNSDLSSALEVSEAPQELNTNLPEAPLKTPTAQTAPKKESTKGQKKKGKPVDPNSGRQRILGVMFEAGVALSTKEIIALLEEKGENIKYVHSHIAYFKAHGQVIHEDKKYRLSKDVRERFERQAQATTEEAEEGELQVA